MRVVYYSNNKVNRVLLVHCLRLIERAVAKAGADLVCVTWEAVETQGTNRLYTPAGPGGHIHIYRQILAGLEGAADEEPVCLAEHDVLYPDVYVTEMVGEVGNGIVTYNRNISHLTPFGFAPAKRDYYYLSNCAGRAGLLRKCAEEKIQECERDRRQRPGSAEFGVGQDVPKRSVTTTVATVDVRHGGNLTGMRFAETYQPELAGWGPATDYRSLFGETAIPLRFRMGHLVAKVARRVRSRFTRPLASAPAQ